MELKLSIAREHHWRPDIPMISGKYSLKRSPHTGTSKTRYKVQARMIVLLTRDVSLSNFRKQRYFPVHSFFFPAMLLSMKAFYKTILKDLHHISMSDCNTVLYFLRTNTQCVGTQKPAVAVQHLTI